MQQAQGIETLQHVASSLGGLGRYGDTYMIHAAEGETVIPLEILDRDPLLKERLFDSMRAMGIDPERYIVGNELNSLNPLTGQPEFFFKTIKKLFKSPIAQAAAGMFLPGGWGIAAAGAMEAIGGGGGKDIMHALARGAGGKFGGDYLGGKGMFEKQGAPDWWTGLKQKMWSPEVAGKTMTDFEKSAKLSGYMKEAATEGLYGIDATNFALENLAQDEIVFNLANQGSKAGIMQKMGSSLMDDPLQSLFVAGMGYGQYDEAKRFNEALKLQQELEQETGGYNYIPSYDVMGDIIDSTTPIVYPPAVTPVAKGGIMNSFAKGGFPRKTGPINGPGTGTSDDIPAMLSDGEFVMTADAVKGAGGGSRAAGTKKMYDMMRRFEGGRA
jgi:hypothetical protein